MKKLINAGIIDRAVTLGFGLAVWIFFGVFYRHHLYYQEQMQLFQHTSEYLAQLMAMPGGLATWVGRLITQFFFNSTGGALLIALLLIAIQRQVLDIAASFGMKPLYRWLTFLPPAMVGALLLDENLLVSGIVSLILSLAAVSCYTRIPAGKIRYLFMILLLPMLYWLAGLGTVVFPLLCLAYEWMTNKKAGKASWGIVALLVLLIALALPFGAKLIVPQYPIQRFWLAGDFSRYVSLYNMDFLTVYLLTVVLIIVASRLPDIRKKNGRIGCVVVQVIVLFAVLAGSVHTFADWKKEEIMGYDYYARMKKWDSIIAMADKKKPNGPLTAAALNLALSQTGQMPDKMFEYIQNGPEGLFPPFTKDFLAANLVGEIFYHVGLVNASQHYTFEGMECIPDQQKSVRSIKRLAETNLINGQYDVAAKYLNYLKNTIFYKRWAEHASTFLYNEEKIKEHPEWGVLRTYQPKEDFLFSEAEKDQMMGVLFQYNPSNFIAYEYLLAYTLLTKDLQHFLDYYAMGEQKIIYKTLPKSYQEALVYIWSMRNPSAPMPQQVDAHIRQRLEAYRGIYVKMENAEPLLRKDFRDTYWYYLHYKGH